MPTTTIPQFNSKSPTIKRILREASELSTHPSNEYHASPLETNLFEWHFTIRGPPSSPYEQGAYHGRIILPPTYPLRPPSFRFLTPSGRFETNREICLSISGHHEETWQPAWGIRTALVALRSFMAQDAKGQVGGLECEEGARRRLAGESVGWRCVGCGSRSNREILEDGTGEVEEKVKVEIPRELRLGYKDEMMMAGKEKKEGSSSSSSPSPPPPSSISSQATTGTSIPSTSQRTTTTTTTTRNTHQQSTNRNASDTAWIDKAIIALLACLVLMIGKKILHF